MRTPSLRANLLATSLSILIPVLVLMNLGIYGAVRGYLYATLEEALEERATIVADLAADLSPEALHARLDRLGIRATIVWPDGTLVSAPALPAASLGPPIIPSQLTDDLLTRDIQVGETRVTVAVLKTGLATLLHRLLLAQAGVSSIAVVTLTGLLYIGTTRSLRPLRHMAATANAVAAGDHGRRLSADRPNTHLGAMASAFDYMVEELGRSVAEAQQAVAHAEAADQQSRRFLADAAHQLRTPITAVSVSLDALLRADTSERRDRALHHLKAETARVTDLVHALLALARLDGAPYGCPPGPTRLAPVVRSEADRFELSHPSVAISIASDLSDPSLWVEISAQDLREILANLIDNAVRHARSSVGITAAPEEDCVRVTVSDDGPGLPPDLHQRAFDRFTSHGNHSGTGLGLAIARELSRRSGGDAIYDRDGFHLILPLVPANPAARPATTYVGPT